MLKLSALLLGGVVVQGFRVVKQNDSADEATLQDLAEVGVPLEDDGIDLAEGSAVGDSFRISKHRNKSKGGEAPMFMQTNQTAGSANGKQIFDFIQNLRQLGFRCPAWKSNGRSGPAQTYAPNRNKQVYDQRLAKAAAKHSKDMASMGRMSHTGSNGSKMKQRMQAEGYSGNSWGENLAFNSGNKNAYQTVQQWQTSKSGHCNNMMDPSFTRAGYGYAASGNNHYWTGNLGA